MRNIDVGRSFGKNVGYEKVMPSPTNAQYRCLNCGLVVDEIPKWEEGECPNDIQHYFRKERYGGEKDGN